MQLTKETILQGSKKGLDFYTLALGELKMVNEHRCENILNPFYEDDNPSLSIYTSEDADRWFHKDYGEESYSGDVFDWAAQYYDLDIQRDFRKILSNMATDLNMRANSDRTEIDDDNKFEYNDMRDENWVRYREYEIGYDSPDKGRSKALNYFSKYGITEDVLKRYNVTAIDRYRKIDWFNKKVVTNTLRDLNLIIAYNDVHFSKLYSPDPKKFWFIGRRNPEHVFGIKELFRKLHKTKTPITTLIITGGEKDVLTLASLGYDAISLNSETANIPHNLIDNWLYAAEHIVILYDIDETGKRRGKEIFDELKRDFSNVAVCTLPDALAEKKGKDVSDYVAAGLSVEELHSLIENCKNRITDKSEDVQESMPDSNIAIIEKHKNDPTLSTPCFSQSIYDRLPRFLKKVCSYFDTPRDKDLVLLSTLGVTSSFFPKVKGIYDGTKIGSNLYLFVSAPPASGKGVMKWGRNLGDSIQASLREKYNQDYKNYVVELAEYNQNKTSNPDTEKPTEPKQPSMFIPANTSVSKMIELMGANKSFGVIFENEGDTLSNALKNDWGNFSDVLRKAFHHETVSMARRGNNEFIEINKPHLSVVLSGTPNQINNLIESVENGFFSRFLFYDFKSPVEWLNHFGKGSNTTEVAFTELATYMQEIWQLQTDADETTILLDEKHSEIVTAYFSERVQLLHLEHGEEIVASVKRFCMSWYRIAMLITIFRTLENNSWLPEKLIISEDDIHLSLSIIDTLFTHLAKVYIRLQSASHLGRLNVQQRKLYEALPPEFSTKEYEDKRQQAGIKIAAGRKYLGDYIQKDVLERVAQGQYKKVV